MLDIFEEFATDPTLETKGTWFPMGKGTELLIARAGNRAFNKLLMKEVEANKVVLDREDDEAEDLSDTIRARVMARTVLLGWRTKTADGFRDALAYKGDVLVYSESNAEIVLQHKDFRNLVTEKSQQADAYKLKQEKDQGNG